MLATDDEPVSGVTWEPPPHKTTYDWTTIAAQLRARPMEWGKIFDGDRVSVANAIRQRSVAAVHPDLGFEVLTGNNRRDGSVRTCTLWLRYNPAKVNETRSAITESRS